MYERRPKPLCSAQLFVHFLADRTNGRAIGTICCVRRRRRLSSVTLCNAKWCVLEQKLLFRAYLWEIDWHQNKWPWPLFRGRGHVNHCVRPTFDVEYLGNR